MAQTAFDAAFDELRTTLAAGGIEAVFERLAEQLKADKRYQELFDARLMQARHRLGLPVILTQSVDDLPAEQQNRIDEALLQTCREVGGLLLNDKRIPEAWMYLRHAGQKKIVAEALANYEPEEEEIDEMLNLAVHEGVAPVRGFQWVLKHFGTCSAVTLFEQAQANMPIEDRDGVAGLMVRHVHQDLQENLRSEIARQEGSPAAEKTIRELVADRDWLFLGDNYHIDTSHLSMTVRFARWLRGAVELELAADITEYGRRLSPQFQYEGEEPFKDLYVDMARFFRAQLGHDVPAALEFFQKKASAAEEGQDGSYPAEVYIALLSRLGEYGEALSASIKYLPPRSPTSGLAPTMLELARLADDYQQLQQVCQDRLDRVNFVAGLIQQQVKRG